MVVMDSTRNVMAWNGKAWWWHPVVSCPYHCPSLRSMILTHWGRVTHICVGKLTIIGSDNGLSPDRHQAIIWTNDGILLIGPVGTNFSEILIEILTFSFKKMRLKVSSVKRRPFCLGLNVLKWIASLETIAITRLPFSNMAFNWPVALNSCLWYLLLSG